MLAGLLSCVAWGENEAGDQGADRLGGRHAGGSEVPAEEEKLRTAVVNIQELFRSFHKVHRAEEEINVERARIQKEHNDVVGRLRSMDQSLRELEGSLQSTVLRDQDRFSLEREKGVRFHEWERLNRERLSNLNARHAELNRKMALRMDALLEEIRDLVAAHAERLNFDLVFDIDGTNTSQVPMLLYAREVTDLTSMIRKELNENNRPRG